MKHGWVKLIPWKLIGNLKNRWISSSCCKKQDKRKMLGRAFYRRKDLDFKMKNLRKIISKNCRFSCFHGRKQNNKTFVFCIGHQFLLYINLLNSTKTLLVTMLIKNFLEIQSSVVISIPIQQNVTKTQKIFKLSNGFFFYPQNTFYTRITTLTKSCIDFSLSNFFRLCLILQSTTSNHHRLFFYKRYI